MTSGIYWAYHKSKDRALYVGSSLNINKRMQIHRTNLKRNKHHNKYFQNIFNKYGKGDIEWMVLEETKPELLKEREQFWVDAISPVCNSKFPVDRPTLGMKLPPFTEEHKRKIAEAKMGSKNPNYKEVKVRDRSKESKFQSAEHRLKRSIAMKGRKFPDRPKRILTDEERKAISERVKAQWANADIRKKMVDGLTGRVFSDETKMKISEAAKKRYATQQLPVTCASAKGRVTQ